MVNWNSFWQEEGDKEQGQSYIETHLSIAKDIEKIIKKYDYRTILDFGCGPAIILKTLAKEYPRKRFTGWDISEHIILQNQKWELKNLHFNIVSLDKIPTDQQFDLVLSISTLHYFPNPLEKIKELLGLVNKNGSLIVNYPNKENLAFYYKRGEHLDYWKQRLQLMFQEKNLITLKQIEGLGFKCTVIREKQPGNKYLQMIKS